MRWLIDATLQEPEDDDRGDGHGCLQQQETFELPPSGETHTKSSMDHRRGICAEHIRL